MAIGWLTAFKDIPWGKVITAAPTIVDGGKALWNRMSKRPVEAPAPPAPPEESPSDALLAAEMRLGALEKKVKDLHEEAVSSFDVVRSLTEQHSQMVHAVDKLIVRTRVLFRVCVLLGIALIALLGLILTR